MITQTNSVLQAWSGIYNEGLHCCQVIEQLPDVCECGDAVAHMEGRCRCCHNASEGAVQGSHHNCAEILAALRADLNIFCQDYMSIATPLQSTGSEIVSIRRAALLTGNALQRIIKAVERVDEAVVGFRRTCDILELRGIKHRALELHEHLTQFNKEMQEAFSPSLGEES